MVNVVWSVSLCILALTSGMFICTMLGIIQLTDTATIVVGVLQMLILPIFVAATIRKNMKQKPVKKSEKRKGTVKK